MRIIDYDKLKKTYTFFSLEPGKIVFGFVLFLILFVIGFLFWCILSPLDDVVSAEVLLRPKENISVVKSPYSGKVVYIGYSDKQFVQSGDVLFIIDTISLKKEIEQKQDQLSSIDNEISALEFLFKTINTESLDGIGNDTEAYFKAVSYISGLEELKNEVKSSELKYLRELEKPDMFKTSYILADLKNLYEGSILKLETYRSTSLLQTTERLERLKTERVVLLKDIERSEYELIQKKVLAPVSGKISIIKTLNVGDNLFETESVLQIVPQNEEELKAELLIKNSDISRVSKGNHVRIRIDGISPSRFGYVEASVTAISPDFSISDDGSYVFVAEAEISRVFVESRRGERMVLVPGLSGNAKIVVGNDKAYSMLLRKLDFLW